MLLEDINYTTDQYNFNIPKIDKDSEMFKKYQEQELSHFFKYNIKDYDEDNGRDDLTLKGSDGYESFEKYFLKNTLSKKDIIDLVDGIRAVYDESANIDYFMENIPIHHKTLFVKKKNNKLDVKAIVLPSLETDRSLDTSKLLVRILRHVDTTDRECLDMSYKLFMTSSKDGFVFGDLFDVIKDYRDIEDFNEKVTEQDVKDVEKVEKEYEKEKTLTSKDKYEQKIADLFIKNLEKSGLEWKKGWVGNGFIPKNPQGRAYNGVNAFSLLLTKLEHEDWKDDRFFTFLKIKEMGLHLKKGAKGIPLKFVKYQKSEAGKWIDISATEFFELKRNEATNIRTFNRYPCVFSAHDVEGLELKLNKEYVNEDVKGSEVIDKISKGIGVNIYNDQDNKAFYIPSKDEIHLPQKTQFLSEDEYNFTALHELVHSTGHEKRLNRDLQNGFGTEKYAKEELVAEIGSAMLSKYLGYSSDKLPDINNNIAYVQSWIKDIKKDPHVLTTAIKNACSAKAYVENTCGLVKELDNDLSDNMQEIYDLEHNNENMADTKDEATEIREDYKKSLDEAREKDKTKENTQNNDHSL